MKRIGPSGDRGDLLPQLRVGQKSRQRDRADHPPQLAWPRATTRSGSGTAFTAATVLLVLLATTGGNLAITWSCLFFMVSAFGFLFPALITSGQEIGRDAPGATSENPAPHAAAAAVVPLTTTSRDGVSSPTFARVSVQFAVSTTD